MAKININLSSGTVDKEIKRDIILGIDLGTTNSLVSYVDDDGKVVPVGDKDGKNVLVPSVMTYNNGQWIVGDKAKEQLAINPTKTLYSIKRLLGRSFSEISERQLAYKVHDNGEGQLVKIEIEGNFFNPIELSAIILKELKAKVEKHLNLPVSKAVITVPAYFDDTQRQATRDAGKLAGLDVLRIINEPTAASLAYGMEQDQGNQIIAVYDLGGGTFDISILRLEDGIYEVLSTAGDTNFGGDNIDEMIVAYWTSRYDLNEGNYSLLRIEAEKAKKHLSSNNEFVSDTDMGLFKLTKRTFDTLIESDIDFTINHVKSAIKDAKLTAADIDNIIMVGGSTRIPYIQDTLSTYFGKPVFTNIDPDRVVSMGAAIQADILAGNNPDVLLIDITPLSLGIETVGGLMDVIIPRNSKIPTGAGRQYTTSVDGQTNLKVSVYQGERDLVENNRLLGRFILKGIPPMAAGIPKIEIHFLIDADGVLIVRAKELRSATQQEIEIKSQFGISEADMGKMLIDSIQNAAADKDIKALIETENEAQNIILATAKFIVQNDAWMTDENKQTLTQHKEALEASILSKDKNTIQQAIEALNAYANPLAQISMEQTIKTSMKGKSI